MSPEFLLLLLALLVSLAMRPWQMLRSGTLLTPLLAVIVLLPWMWALPRMHSMPLPLQLSGACMATLMLGWPLAVPVLMLVAGISGIWAPASDEALVLQTFWQGVLPATFAVLWGALLRRFAPAHIFVYTLGRAFLGTVLSMFAAQALAQWAGYDMPGISDDTAIIARWLVSWGDGFMTGLLSAIFVAFEPAWMATWSDKRYLQPRK